MLTFISGCTWLYLAVPGCTWLYGANKCVQYKMWRQAMYTFSGVSVHIRDGHAPFFSMHISANWRIYAIFAHVREYLLFVHFPAPAWPSQIHLLVAYLNICKLKECTKCVLQTLASYTYVGFCDKGLPTYSPVLLVVNQSILHNEGILSSPPWSCMMYVMWWENHEIKRQVDDDVIWCQHDDLHHEGIHLLLRPPCRGHGRLLHRLHCCRLHHRCKALLRGEPCGTRGS